MAEKAEVTNNMDFREHVKKKILRKDTRILEFGPLTRPTVTRKTHPNIRFADVRSSEEIKALYTSNDYLKSTGLSVDLDTIVDIDYVVKGTYAESFKGVEKFDVVILSHVIEHMPDIIFFFEDVMNLLKDDGRLVLIYPDARYCFDHFRNGSTFVDAYDVYKNKANSSKRVLDFVFNVVKENNPYYYWNEAEQENILPTNSFSDALSAYDKAIEGELPDDTHFWPFADYQFVKFLYDMDRAGLLQLNILDFYKTQENTQEFMIVLSPKKEKGIKHATYKKLLNKISPSRRLMQERELRNNVVTLEMENKRLQDELKSVYSSKKWKYVSNLGNVRNVIMRKNAKN